MVKLEVLEDEHFLEKSATTGDEVLLADDDDDYTDTDSEISDASDLDVSTEETLLDRITALKDMVPPQARARISSITSSLYSATSSTVSFSGKALWVIASSTLLLGLPYALALGDEQQFQDEEAQRSQMQEGAQGMINTGEGGEVRQSL